MVKIIRSIVLIILLVDLTGCVLPMILDHPNFEMWQSKRLMAEDKKQYEAFMAKKTPEERRLYLKNRRECTHLANEKEETEGGHFNFHYDDCMEERGTPDY